MNERLDYHATNQILRTEKLECIYYEKQAQHDDLYIYSTCTSLSEGFIYKTKSNRIRF